MYSTAFVSSRLLHFRFRIPEYSGSISFYWLSVKSVGYGLRSAPTSFMLLLYHVSLMKTSSYIAKLRDKLTDCHDFQPVTVRGVGYKAVLA